MRTLIVEISWVAKSQIDTSLFKSRCELSALMILGLNTIETLLRNQELTRDILQQ